MKSICVIAVLILLVGAPLSLWSLEESNGAQLFKTKCSNCHGANGEGKSAMNFPAIKGSKMSVEKLVAYLTKGESGNKIHSRPVKNLSAEQAASVAEYIQTLK
jgi:cytochrome c553